MLNHPFEEGARIIAEQGFAVDVWWTTDRDMEGVFSQPGIECGMFSGYFGGVRNDPAEGAGTLHPDSADLFLEHIETSLKLAQKIGCRNLALSSGQLGPDGEIRHPIHEHPITRWITAYKTLCRIAELAEKYDVTYNMEHLNVKDSVEGDDHKGYVYPAVEDVVRMVREVGSPRLKLLLDFYQAQVQEGNLTELIRRHHQHIGYIHLADAPHRAFPGRGEINMPLIVGTLREVGYEGPVGLECCASENPIEDMNQFRKMFT